MTVTIESNGVITVAMSDQERALALMLLADRSATIFSDVVNLAFNREVQAVMNARFARLSPADQADVLTKMEQASEA